ncbi:MAG: ATP-dependent DNA ligase [Desulfobacterales bacterium]
MKAFAGLFAQLDATPTTNLKVAAMADYFRAAAPADAAWAVYFLTGRKPRQSVPTARLRQWAAEEADIAPWLFDAAYEAVGDLAETIALLLPAGQGPVAGALHEWVADRLLPLGALAEGDQRRAVVSAWSQMGAGERLVWNKLITGGFRVGVSQRLVTRALAAVSGLDVALLAHRLMGHWTPDARFFRELLTPETADAHASRPYPFFLAHPLEGSAAALGPVTGWQAEWKWDGIRVQLIRREGRVFLWSRGEELITEGFPELAAAAAALPEGTVVDGEILAWQGGAPLPFTALQRRIGRQQASAHLQAQVPVVLMAFDLLEADGRDLRPAPLDVRCERLAAVLAAVGERRLRYSAPLENRSWSELADLRLGARQRGVEGLMLKARSSAYGVGRRRGAWWKWKVDPFSVDAVLVYAQAGHGRRAGLYTDYTFAVWDGAALVPFAKAYSGLSDLEIREVDRFIRRNTLEKHGPVRAVAPELVFEIAFEGIGASKRHKSGVAVRFPRIARWRRDKRPRDADSLAGLRALMPQAGIDNFAPGA